MKKFKVREKLVPYIEKELERKKTKYCEVTIGNEIYISCNLSGMEFHRIVESALCFEQQGTSNIPVLSFNMIKDKKTRLQRLNGIGVYHVLKKDIEKINYL